MERTNEWTRKGQINRSCVLIWAMKMKYKFALHIDITYSNRIESYQVGLSPDRASTHNNRCLVHRHSWIGVRLCVCFLSLSSFRCCYNFAFWAVKCHWKNWTNKRSYFFYFFDLSIFVVAIAVTCVELNLSSNVKTLKSRCCFMARWQLYTLCIEYWTRQTSLNCAHKKIKIERTYERKKKTLFEKNANFKRTKPNEIIKTIGHWDAKKCDEEEKRARDRMSEVV